MIYQHTDVYVGNTRAMFFLGKKLFWLPRQPFGACLADASPEMGVFTLWGEVFLM